MNFNDLKTKYALFYGEVKDWHQNSERAHRGHGLDHDVTVAQICLKIAPDEKTGELAWIAALLHSVDRTVERGNKTALKNKLDNLMSWLPHNEDVDRWPEIFSAAFGHGELNNPDQGIIQQVLMDADRLANLMLLVTYRAGQFMPDLPAIEFEYVEKPNPASTYRSPCSVFDDSRANLSLLPNETGYIEQLRLPKAKELGAIYWGELNLFLLKVAQQHREIGLSDIEL